MYSVLQPTGINITVSKSNISHWCINILRIVWALFISSGMMKTIEGSPSINLSQPHCGEILAASLIQLNPSVMCTVLVIKYLTTFVLQPQKAVAKQNLEQDALKQNRKCFCDYLQKWITYFCKVHWSYYVSLCHCQKYSTSFSSVQRLCFFYVGIYKWQYLHKGSLCLMCQRFLKNLEYVRWG